MANKAKALASQWAQGDVLIIHRGPNKEKVKPVEGLMVLEGEATGHNHLLYGRVVMFRDDGMASAAGPLYIGTVKIGAGGAELRHEHEGKLTGDHATIKLPANTTLEVRRQRQEEGPGQQPRIGYVAD